MIKSTVASVMLLAATVVAAAGGGTAAAARQGSSAITGLWSTGSQEGRVELYRCGTATCGKVDAAAPLPAHPDHSVVKNPHASPPGQTGRSACRARADPYRYNPVGT